jgi:chemosensory pili system protein ChpA (sensor histidine kinase/response regulator)
VKLNELIEALAAEVEMAQPRLARSLEELAVLDAEDAAFMDALDGYSGQAQRMGEAAEMAGFPGLQAVCGHVLQNTLAMPMLEVADRGELIDFLRGWPPLVVYYLRHSADPTAAAGLVDHLVKAPYPLEEEDALKVMHKLGAMPQQVLPGAAEPQRPVLATQEDVALVMPVDADPKLLEGFFHEAPEQARYLVELARNMVGGQGDSSDLVAAKRVAHTLKGSGAIIGLRGLASLGHHFEDILEHFERQGGVVAKPAADALLDAAFCLEQMVGYVAGSDEYPGQARSVLQAVLDLANRIDRGESLESPVARVDAQPYPAGAAQQPAAAAPLAAPGAALRITVERVDELFRLSGEVSVHSAAMESRIKALAGRSHELLAQNLRVQKRLFELETLVDVRALTMMRARTRRSDEQAFDPLEMDQYSELHSTAHALAEDAADARVMALQLEEGIAQLESVQARHERLAKDLQHLVIGTRMTAASVLESRLQRNVRTTCQATGRQATLVLTGGDTQIDTDVLNRLTEPLLHLLRNAVDHGLELPHERAAAGKDEAGRIELAFTRQGQQVVMRCSDDGRGLDLAAIRDRAVARGLVAPGAALDDDETARLILLPGFTTCDAVNEVSGRGIGLDVVREWAATMGGTVRFETRMGAGCTVELRFAASLSTIHSLIVQAGGHRFALASLSIEQALPRGAGVFETVGEQLVYRYGKRVLPALRLAQAVGLPDAGQPGEECDAVIARVDDKLQAIAVERLVDSRELLVKSPGLYARHVRGVVGLSILGDGGLAVNLDLSQLLGSAKARHRALPEPAAAVVAPERHLPAVLIVDDALSVRNSLMQLVQDAGFRAQAARDGVDAIETLRDFRADLVLTDLEMPNMNGIELTAHIRGRQDTKDLPVIMITSRSQQKHRDLATQAGVDGYVTKPYNDGDLLQTIREALAA